jgi:glycosyltransferase involved in cell wall biosynthesis
MVTNVAVLIPCLNEEAAISKVVSDFRAALPGARICVYDNGSTDRTVEIARAAGAEVHSEPLRGKGNVIRRMFADVDADVYVLVDGDDTYDASVAGELVRKLQNERLDMVNAARVTEVRDAYRPGHRLGNQLLTGMVSRIFSDRIGDLLSGYRVFSRRYVKSFPALSKGFEIETELTIHALELRMPIAEVTTTYKDRPVGSQSKLRTYRDGLRILTTILVLLKEERPLAFFSVLCAALAAVSIALAIPVFDEFLMTGLVPRLPTAVLSTGLMILAFLSLAAGLILDSVTRARQELKRLHYLQYPAAPAALTYSGASSTTGGGRKSANSSV